MYPLPRLTLLGLCLAAAACSDEPETPREHVDQVQVSIDAGNWEGAQAALDQAQQSVSEGSPEWLQLQGQQLETLARAGSGPEALALLEQVATDFPEQFDHREYLAVVYWLTKANACSHLEAVIDAGSERYPEHSDTVFEEAKTQSADQCGKEGVGGQAGLESLGYL